MEIFGVDKGRKVLDSAVHLVGGGEKDVRTKKQNQKQRRHLECERRSK
jgi:hypothetical protein